MRWLIALALLAGCDACDKCIVSHVETQQCVSYIYVYGPNMEIYGMIPNFYDCQVEVCDVYERPVTP